MSVQCSKKFAKPNCSPLSVKRSVPLNVCVRDLEHTVFSENAHHCMALLCLLTSAADIICVCVCVWMIPIYGQPPICASHHTVECIGAWGWEPSALPPPLDQIHSTGIETTVQPHTRPCNSNLSISRQSELKSLFHQSVKAEISRVSFLWQFV